MNRKSSDLIVALVGSLLAVILVSMISGCAGNYIKNVKGWKPYSDSGIKATCGDVLDKYISSCKWTQEDHPNGVSHDIYASGLLGGHAAIMRFYVNESRKTISWGVKSFTIDDEEEDGETWLANFFDAYNQGFESMADYFSD